MTSISYLPANRSEEQQVVLECITRLVHTCNHDALHSRHTTFLALRLFDELRELHRLGEKERFWLESASLLHDIGWSVAWKGHHKIALQIIMETPILPFDNRERMIIGSIARYHRSALPSPKHDHYASLDEYDRQIVDQLAAMLRLADGLDRTKRSMIRDLCCKITARKITIFCAVDMKAPEEKAAAEQKSDLMEVAYYRKVRIKWRTSL